MIRLSVSRVFCHFVLREVVWPQPLLAGGFFRPNVGHTDDLGLRRLNRQIPHAD
jgi:hypothetical protein